MAYFTAIARALVAPLSSLVNVFWSNNSEVTTHETDPTPGSTASDAIRGRKAIWKVKGTNIEIITSVFICVFFSCSKQHEYKMHVHQHCSCSRRVVLTLAPSFRFIVRKLKLRPFGAYGGQLFSRHLHANCADQHMSWGASAGWMNHDSKQSIERVSLEGIPVLELVTHTVHSGFYVRSHDSTALFAGKSQLFSVLKLQFAHQFGNEYDGTLIVEKLNLCLKSTAIWSCFLTVIRIPSLAGINTEQYLLASDKQNTKKCSLWSLQPGSVK